jgi:transcriptional regulator with XRE-family HTH domain
MIRFDAKALYVALDEHRRTREMSWEQVAAAIGVSVGTIIRTREGGRMEVDGMLAMVSWLGVPVETFVREVRAKPARRTGEG